MPLDEEGAKWSCEPCIRGHRSSKCQHFDRLMMKVPKAGRPLTKCPHPKEKGSCECNKTFSMMIRIPKGSGCVCRPVSSAPQNENAPPNSESIGSARAPQSVSVPSLPISPASKVQKSGRRQGSIQAAPENISRALESMPSNLKWEEGVSDNQLSSYPLEQNGYNFDVNKVNGYRPMNPLPEVSHAPQKPNGSSCCSKKPPPPPPVAPHGGGSCCSGKAGSQPKGPPVSNLPELHHRQETLQNYQNQQPAWNGASYSGFPPSQMAWHNPMTAAQLPSQGQFIPSYGLQESQMPPVFTNVYSQNGRGDPYSRSVNGLGITPAESPMSSYTPTPSQHSVYTPTHVSGDMSHDCECGEGCQCLGCAVHPFNNTTRQHVQEMGEMMTIGRDNPPFETYSSPSLGPQNWDHYNYMVQGPEQSQSFQANNFDPWSSPVPVGQAMNEQLMNTSEYHTLEYSVGIPSACSDVTGSCRCGNDCCCVGCLTHSGHSGLPLNTALHDSTVPAHSNHHTPDGEVVTSTTSSMQPSRIPVLENLSVPCLSPRTLETSMI